MPYQVRQLIEGQGDLVCTTRDEPVTIALSAMVEHDFSQLPVIRQEQGIKHVEGMITYEGILRGIRNFQASLSDLRVRDVMLSAPVFDEEDDLFDILDRLKDTNAVFVINRYDADLIGIVTSYDTAEYFRNRTEDLMRVEDIELSVKDFIRAAYTLADGEVDEGRLDGAIARVTSHPSPPEGSVEKRRSFEDLNLGEYISLLLLKDTWPFFEPILGVQPENVRKLLSGVREIRNALAHFRGDLSPDQRDRLRFAAEWLPRCQEEFQARAEAQEYDRLRAQFKDTATPDESLPAGIDSSALDSAMRSLSGSVDYSITESSAGGGRYGALADWLQSQPGRVDHVRLTFAEIEQIVGSPLPPSARGHRAWWANDSVGHSHSQQWLAAGWRTTSINLTEAHVTFGRIREREQAYIAFFSKLLDDLRKTGRIPMKEASPDGASWIIVHTLPRQGGSYGAFTYSFSRDKRFRVELYLDLEDQVRTKAVFDRLYAQKDRIEAKAGTIEWERLDHRRASRLALYYEASITEDSKHAELRRWAVGSMVKFHDALAGPAEEAILEARK